MTPRRTVMHRVSARLSHRREYWLYAVLAFAWTSGVAWLVFHYFLNVQGEFGVTPNPLEPLWLKLHGAAAFLSLWIGGLVWAAHVAPAWSQGSRRSSGIAMIVLFAVIAGSGYLLYYAGGESLRATASLVHWIVGAASPLLLIVHVLRRHVGYRRGRDAHRRVEFAAPLPNASKSVDANSIETKARAFARTERTRRR